MVAPLHTCTLDVNTTLPLVCICSLFSFLCGVGIGANDLSANFAMVVGSGSLHMRQAIVYCAVFELLGAAFMGGRVSRTLRGGLVSPLLFVRNRDVVVLGMTSASFAAALWLYLSTVFGLPVSITHTVIGSILGFALVVVAGGGAEVSLRGDIEWSTVAVVVLSWVIAPLAACAVTAALFALLRRYVLNVSGGGGSFARAYAVLPYCLAASLLMDVAFIAIEQPPLMTQRLSRWVPLPLQLLALVVATVAFTLASAMLALPRLADAAQTARSFVWESAVLRTAPPTRATATAATDDNATAAAAATLVALPSASLSASFAPLHLTNNSGSSGGGGGASSNTLLHHGHVHLAPMPVQHRNNGDDDAAAAAATTTPHAPLLPRKLDGSSNKNTVDTTAAATAYGTMDSHTRSNNNDASAAVAAAAHDIYGDPDWAMDHAMQPIRIGGLLLKPFNPRAEYLFTGLQVVAGSMSSFVHGAVAGANATAAFVLLYDAFTRHELGAGDLSTTWSVLPAMFGIAIGMCALGASLMKTVGVELVTVTPVRGWCIQLGSTLVTMVLTGIGIPVSLSQAQVGAAIGCGVLDAKLRGVSWSLVGKIAVGWVVTLATSAATTALAMYALGSVLC